MRDQVRVLHLPIRLSLPIPAVSGNGVRGPERHRGPGGHALVVKRQLAGGTGAVSHLYLFINLFIETDVLCHLCSILQIYFIMCNNSSSLFQTSNLSIFSRFNNICPGWAFGIFSSCPSQTVSHLEAVFLPPGNPRGLQC